MRPQMKFRGYVWVGGNWRGIPFIYVSASTGTFSFLATEIILSSLTRVCLEIKLPRRQNHWSDQGEQYFSHQKYHGCRTRATLAYAITLSERSATFHWKRGPLLPGVGIWAMSFRPSLNRTEWRKPWNGESRWTFQQKNLCGWKIPEAKVCLPSFHTSYWKKRNKILGSLEYSDRWRRYQTCVCVCMYACAWKRTKRLRYLVTVPNLYLLSWGTDPTNQNT